MEALRASTPLSLDRKVPDDNSGQDTSYPNEASFSKLQDRVRHTLADLVVSDPWTVRLAG
jgi:hypothetical protein